MKNNDITSTNSNPSSHHSAIGQENELAAQFLDILNFTGLMESQAAQTVISFMRRINGSQDLEYVIAVSG